MINPERILVVKLSDIGDVLTATPALRALRQSFPKAQLEVLLPPNSREVLDGSPLTDQLIIFDKFQYDRPLDALAPTNLTTALRLGRWLRERRLDTLILLHHLTTGWGALKYATLALASGAPRRLGLDNGRGWFLTDRVKDHGFGFKHEVAYWLDVVGELGATTEDSRLEISITAEEEEYAANLLNGGQTAAAGRIGPVVAVHPGSGGYSRARRWSAAGFAQVADALVERYGARVMLVGKGSDGLAEVAALMKREARNLADQTTIKQLAALLKRCDLFLGNDGGVMHLAAAVGTPVVAIFGPSNHRAWGPWGDEHAVVRLDLPCSPCFYRGFELGTPEGCASRECLTSITSQQVLAAIE
ncbi:MAG: glycosyltransferase family 9 protein, partial [Anaerolineae bacterium]